MGNDLFSVTTYHPNPIEGISAQRVVLRGTVPNDGVEYLAAEAGDSPFVPGSVLAPGTTLPRPIPAWFHPRVGEESPLLLGMDIPVIAETPDVLVVNKPHGLPSTPNGRFMRACAQTMLRVRREESDLVAIHRLDRLTGGVLVLSRRPETRSYLQTQFQNRTVRKVYEAVSAYRLPHLSQWTRFEVEMTKIPHDPQVKVGQGNGKTTETWVRLLGPVASDQRKEAASWRYEVRPKTGHTHQIRALMNHLGAPLIGDDTYPEYQPRPAEKLDPTMGLQAVELTLCLPGGEEAIFRAPGWELAKKGL
ncbi:pseudouridine synthase [Corynebacterium resistens DSM 45100]|uniref:RNA pseudouridylate synthase n=1 Tax=Corynebacterium resistens (strain DSM 45100 / JCM 12819 / GTC 2026 / SICGH 158) TaxID=662755 RepID=F8DZK3_CORRG|nr:pseudouridine synthase [Corynebacterium resistens]AEI09822.1 pseudouridine synthase [Corynebacterium resistens DSM 45100]